MHIFITGTDTNIGKTLISSWLCLHTGYGYFKPIQTGTSEGTDSQIVAGLTDAQIYQESYLYKDLSSPHLAASLENQEIDIAKINFPKAQNLIIEGAGGLLVPINKDYLMIDLIKYFSIPVIIVARSSLGTINHTLLSLEVLQTRNITTLGVIMTGELNQPNADAIEYYGKTKVLAQFPFISSINKDNLKKIPLSQNLQKIFGI